MWKIKDKRVVLLQSGGLDSCYLACFLSKLDFEIHHLYVDYGQNANKKELEAVEKIVAEYGGTLHKAKLDMPWLHDSTILCGHEVGEYGVSETMGCVEAKTYVPMRNHLLISLASSLAESLDIKYIASALDGSQDIFGRPKGGTPDKHPNFVKKLEQSLSEASTIKHIKHDKFEIIAPTISQTKETNILRGLYLGCDFGLSWTCYNNSDEPCGECCACIDRANHFANVGVEDPLISRKNNSKPLE